MKAVLLVGTGSTISGAAPDAPQTLGYRKGAVPFVQLVAHATGFIAGGLVGPLKARLLLQCCLVAGLDAAAIQQHFLRVAQMLSAD